MKNYFENLSNKGKMELLIHNFKKEEEENKKMIDTCNEMLEFYKYKIQASEKKIAAKKIELEEQLKNYMQDEKLKETKTQSKLQLPSAEIIIKKEAQKIEAEKDLIDWIEDNAIEFIKVEQVKKVDWINYKKTLSIIDNDVVDKNGQIVEKVIIKNVPKKFEIKYL